MNGKTDQCEALAKTLVAILFLCTNHFFANHDTKSVDVNALANTDNSPGLSDRIIITRKSELSIGPTKEDESSPENLNLSDDIIASEVITTKIQRTGGDSKYTLSSEMTITSAPAAVATISIETVAAENKPKPLPATTVQKKDKKKIKTQSVYRSCPVKPTKRGSTTSSERRIAKSRGCSIIPGGIILCPGEGISGATRSIISRLDSQKKQVKIIKKESLAAGVSWIAMVADAQIESGIAKYNKCNASRHCGMYQFSYASWKIYGSGSRSDLTASTKAALKYRKVNKKKLSDNGIPQTDVNLYLSHQQGGGGALELDTVIKRNNLPATKRRSQRKRERRLVIAVCSNIPMDVRLNLCKQECRPNSKRPYWTKRSGISIKDLVVAHKSIWTHEHEILMKRIKAYYEQ